MAAEITGPLLPTAYCLLPDWVGGFPPSTFHIPHLLVPLACSVGYGTKDPPKSGANMTDPHHHPQIKVRRVQTGVRIEHRMLKVLKALAEYFDLSLGDLLEGIVLHAFEGRSPFDCEALKRIEALKQVYDMDYDASASHHFVDAD